MRIGKIQLLGLLAGAVLLGGVASVTAQESPADPPAEKAKAAMHERGPKMARHAIRSESVVPGEEEGTFRTIRTDRGELTAIDGSTLTIDEADGTTVEIVVDDDTKLNRDGEDATIADLDVGDQIFAFRYDDGDGFVTKAVKAISAERFAAMEAKREACKANPDECRKEMKQRRRDRARPSGFAPTGGFVGGASDAASG